MAKPDPFLERLDQAAAQPPTTGKGRAFHLQATSTLYVIHYKKDRSGFDALTAVVLCGRLGIVPPTWAIDFIDKASRDAVQGIATMDQGLGFRGQGKGNTKGAAVQQRLHALFYDEWCKDVMILVQQGQSPAAACTVIAQRLKTPGWNKTTYDIKPPLAETLLDHFRHWESNVASLKPIMDDPEFSDGK